MKKLFALFALFALTSCVFSQSTSPRYGTLKNQDNTGRALTYGYLTPTKSATMTIAPNFYNTLIAVPALTIAPTYSFVSSNGHTADRVTIITTASAATRTVVLSGAVNYFNDSMVIGSGKKGVLNFIFDGSKYVEVSRTVEP